jgi:medium-chain acyl-[acyl-carrier-protein] hydrolase
MSTIDKASDWFFREVRPQSMRCRVFCFPYAGGSSAIFRGWHTALPASAEVMCLQLPGRAGRYNVAPIASLSRLTSLLADHIAPLMQVPCLFFGHSNGALIGYALAVELAKRGLPLPQHLVLSAKRPPHLIRSETTHDLPTPQFIDRLRKLNGTTPEVLADPELLDIVLPVLRADLAMGETYRPEPVPPLPCRVSLMGSTGDAEVPLDELRQWGRYFVQPPALHVFEGDHFFIHSARDELLRTLSPLVQACIDGT